MGKKNELVMGVDRRTLFDSGFYFTGFIEKGSLTSFLQSTINMKAAFRYRGNCESDPDFKQIIPYCLITRNEEEIFVYSRKPAGAEARLHDKSSFGIGGHINPEEKFMKTELIIFKNLIRELNEEVAISTDIPKPELVGMINYDYDEVGKVHLGLVYLINLPVYATVSIRETDQLEGRFLSKSELNTVSNFETWSRLLLDYLSR